MNRILVDLDGTLCHSKGADEDYSSLKPNPELVQRMREAKSEGAVLDIYTARGMRTHGGDLESIRRLTLPVIIDWLESYEIPFRRVIVGKEWPGRFGFYVDDRAVRPGEWVSLGYAGVQQMLAKEALNRHR